jgi:hypothetical protein
MKYPATKTHILAPIIDISSDFSDKFIGNTNEN